MKGINSQLLESFLQSYFYLGSKYPVEFTGRIQYKYRNWNILNLNLLQIDLKQSLNFIYQIHQNNKRLLFILDSDLYSFFSPIFHHTNHLFTSDIKKAIEITNTTIAGNDYSKLIDGIVFIGVRDLGSTKILSNLKYPLITLTANPKILGDYFLCGNNDYHSSMIMLKILLKQIFQPNQILQ